MSKQPNTTDLRTAAKFWCALLGLCLLISTCSGASEGSHQVLIRDITSVAGVRDNQLIGYGIVVGLNGTGDRSQTVFTTQTLANAMRRMGLQLPVSPTSIMVKNVAAVFVTASMPPFSRPGVTLDVTVSSIGDAKSLEGGVLLLTALHAADGAVYAEAQGPLTLGGYSIGSNGNFKNVNHATVGRVPEGAIVEKDASVDLANLSTLSFMLREADFGAARDIAAAINRQFQKTVSKAVDGREISVNIADTGVHSVPALIAEIQHLGIEFHPPAKVVVNERTGTIVMGGDVKLSPVSILHGSLSIDVTTELAVSQPVPFSSGKTKVIPETTVSAEEQPAKSIRLTEGASVEALINGLHAIGATARDIVAILQAIKAAGGLQAELEVL